ncbi:hypothetical protein PO380_20725 [Klebsiella oxytoca]|uniref:hypothetical protein n=1 Tax=Klebsiella oxytoca TaxID=571 RepID=UPI002FF938D5
MAWLGVPFKFLEGVGDSISLSVRTLPNIVLKSSDSDYTSLWVTALVSIAAGLIPAGIAYYTFVQNSKNIKMERQAQHDFLKNEREEQQRFLREERTTQIYNSEEDRKTQAEIAKINFNMQVLSVNRQVWINNLRDLISEYISIAPEIYAAQHDFINKQLFYTEVANKRLEVINSGHESKDLSDAYNKSTLEVEAAMLKVREYRVKEKHLSSKIKLMLNPKEEWYSKIVSILQTINKIINSLTSSDLSPDVNVQRHFFSKLDDLMICTQDVLKYEWERVKKGE